MLQMKPFRFFALISLPFLICLTVAAQGDTEAIQLKLNSQFRLTTTTADRTDIVTPGDVVVIQKPGLVMYAVASPLPPSNTYKNGRITQGWGGFGKDLAIGMSGGGATANDFAHRTFVPQEKCWVTKIAVEKDGILFELYSDPYGDTRYYGNLKIPFPHKKEVPSADEALQSVGEVLTVVPGDNQGGPAGQPAQAPPPVQPPPPPAQPAAPMAAIPPPPPPADEAPPTVTLGETKEQVTASFGQPLREAKLGTKEIYYYKGMKVTFKAGKVTDVE